VLVLYVNESFSGITSERIGFDSWPFACISSFPRRRSSCTRGAKIAPRAFGKLTSRRRKSAGRRAEGGAPLGLSPINRIRMGRPRRAKYCIFILIRGKLGLYICCCSSYAADLLLYSGKTCFTIRVLIHHLASHRRRLSFALSINVLLVPSVCTLLRVHSDIPSRTFVISYIASNKLKTIRSVCWQYVYE
jgi:hypothetical protein